MRNLVVIFLVAAVCVFIGCLGGGGGGSSFSGGPATEIPSSALISGRVYFPESSLYGGIPIIARDSTGVSMGSVRTDSHGNFHFTELAPGLYDLYASTGESEVRFFTGAQVVPQNQLTIPDKRLVELIHSRIDRITSTSVRLVFDSSVACSSQIEFGPSVGTPELLTVNNNFVENHEVTVTGLQPDTRYGFKIMLSTQDGQQFSYPAMSTTTNKPIGPTNLSISIENGDMITRFAAVRIYLDADDASEFRIGTRENLEDQIWEGISPFRDLTLPAGDGTKRVYVQFRDSFGNVSSVINDSILLQTDATGYIGIWINGGQALTNKNEVVLSMLYPGATHMQVSERTDFLNSFWELFSASRRFSFSTEDGTKNIYVRFKDANGKQSDVFSSAIILDTTGPEVTMKINNGALKTNNINVSLNFFPIQTPSEMQVEEDGVFDEFSTWIRFSNPYTFLVSKGDELKTVYARFKDELGNPFGPISAQIELDTTPPQNAEFDINGGDQTTDSIEVRLTMSADDASKILISNNENFAGAVPESYKTIKNWSLGGYGVQSVYMQFIDDASNTTSALVQSIEVIGEPPASGTVTINQNDPSTEVATVSLYVFSDDVKNIRVGTHQNFSSLPDIEYVANYVGGVVKIDDFALAPLAGEKMVFVRFESSSGLFSVASDSIILVGPGSYSLTTNDTQPLSTYTVNLRPFAEDATQMLITEDYLQLSNPALWQSFSYSYDFLLGKTSGKHTVYAKYRNSGGVETPVLSLDLTVSELAPASPAIILNAGDSLTYRNNVQVNVLANPDYPTMRLSNDGNFFAAQDTAAVSQPWYLSNYAGEKIVHARFQHKDTGEYFYASDTIVAVGPASPTILTSETLPLNKNWVILKLFAAGASDMIVTEDPGIASISVGWQPYQNSLIFPLENYTGAHTVYAKFRNSPTNYIETVPVKLALDVNSSSPSGNTATVRDTAAIDASVVSEVAVGSLPVYLHFDIQDEYTASISWAIASAGAPLPDVYNEISAPAAPIPLSNGDFPGNGTFNIFYKFSDGVGNETSIQILSVRILGPSIKISPASLAPVKSGQTQQFAATLENVEGTVRWSISPNSPTTVYGSINSSTGLYSAPTTVLQNASFTVRAELLSDSSINDSVEVELVTQVEIIVAQTNYQITKGESTDITVRFRNSAETGSVLSPTFAGGTAAMTAYTTPADPPTDSLATLSYTAPNSATNDNVEITSIQDTSKKKIIYFTVNDGPWVTITPDSARMRVRSGNTSFAADTSSSTGTLSWFLPKGGFFNSAKTATTTTTTGNGNHLVTVYAPDDQTINPIEIVASFTEGGNVPFDKASITLENEVTVTITPRNQKMYLADTTSLIFMAELSDNATTSEVIWEYKNDSETDWVRADNYVNEDNGILTLNLNEAEYFPPATWPTDARVNIRATSVDDPAASDTTYVDLIEPLRVEIYDGYNSSAPKITEASISVTLEVGKRQLFAEVGPVTDPTINTSVNWSVQGVAGGNTTYGTIDSTGKYTAPDSAPQAAVTVRAVSVANTSAFAETTINLLDFWTPRSEGLQDATNATNSVYCLQIDQTSAAGLPRVIYCGTNGFGVYVTSISPSGSEYSWDTVDWVGVDGLSTDLVGMGASYTVNDLTMSLQDPERVVAATNHGLFLVTNNGSSSLPIVVPEPRTAPHDPAATVTEYSSNFTKVFSGVVIDPTDDDYLYATGKDQGVLRFKWNATNYEYDGTIFDDDQIYSRVEFYDWPWSVNTGTVATPSIETGSLNRPRMILDASGTMEFNCLAMTPHNPNVLYVGFTKYLETRGNPDVFRVGYIKFNNIRTSEYLYIGPRDFIVTGNPPPAGIMSSPYSDPAYPGGYPDGQPEVIDNWRYIGGSGVINWDTDGIIQSIAIDPNTPTTIWRGKNNGIQRSTDDGNTFSSLGNYVNVRDIFIDPINTVNVYIGTEAGLYRTKDAGSSWKQIKTGLEGNTTLNALGLTPGGLGSRRIFLGTTNGIFMGRTSLDLE